MIDPTWLIIGFFFITLLFLVAVGAFVYEMRRTLKGVHSELKKQNRALRRGEIAVITGDLPAIDPGRTTPTTEPSVPVLVPAVDPDVTGRYPAIARPSSAR